MKVFIDFDDVIFNTKQFKDDLKDVFLKFGISNELYEKTYYDSGDVRTVKVYDPRAQVERIKKVHAVDGGKLLESINAFMDSGKQYVFDDVVDFIDFVEMKNICILSYGDIEFQKEKIKSSDIVKYVENVFVTDKLKALMVENIIETENIINGEKLIFLDDRVEQICDVRKKFPDIITVLVKRPEGRYQEMQKESCCDYEVCNLKEVKEIISKL